MCERYDFHEEGEYPWWASITAQKDGAYVLHSDYATLERRLVELQEAVRKMLGEYDSAEGFSKPYRREAFAAARASVDALVGEG
jgi:hypothetical protein